MQKCTSSIVGWFSLSHFSKCAGFLFCLSIFVSGCGGGRGQGNDTLEEGGLGIELAPVGGENQIHARRQVYAQPLVVKVVESEGGTGVPDVPVTFRELTSTGALFPSTARTNNSGEASIWVTSPNRYSAVVQIKASITGARSTANFTLTTIPDTVTSIAFGPTPPPVHMADDIVPISSFKVQLLDSYGFLIDTNSADDVTMSLAAGSGTLGGTLTRRVSSGLSTFADLKYQTLENVRLKATHVPTGLTTETDMLVVNGPSTQLAFTSQPNASYVAGQTIEPVLELRDKFGNVVSYGADSTAPISLAVQQGTGTLGGTTSVNAVAGVASFVGTGATLTLAGNDKIIRARKPATSGFGGTAALQRDSNVFTIVPAPPQSITVAGATDAVAGTCQAFVITTRDQYTNPSNVASSMTVNLTESGSGSFYSDSGCSTSITSTTIAAGTNSATVYFKNTVAPETNLLSFDDGASGLTDASRTLAVTPASPSEFYFSGPSTLIAGRCSAAYQLVTRDPYGNTSALTTSKTISLAGGNGTFYSDASCSSSLTSFGLAAGQSGRTLYFKDNRAESISLIADDGAGGLSPSSFALTIGADRLAVAGSASIRSGTCAAFSIQGQDPLGNVANVLSNTTVNVSEVGVGSLFSDASCTTPTTTVSIASGSSSTPLYYKNDVAQSASIAASDASGTLGSGSLALTVLPDRILLAGPTALVTNVCSAVYTFTVKDAAGNTVPLTSSTPIYLTGKENGTFYSDASCSTTFPGDTLTLASGNAIGTFYYKNPANEGASLSVDDGAGNLTAGVVNVSVGPDRLKIVGASQVMSGVCVPYNVITTDPSDTPTNVAFATSVTLSGKSDGAFYSDNTCSTLVSSDQLTIGAGANSANFYYKKNVAAAVTLGADDAGSLTPASKIVDVGPDRLVIGGVTNLKSGTCSGALTINARDTAGNNAAVLANTTVTVTGGGNGTFYLNNSCTTALAGNTLVMATGSNSAQIYFKDDVAESLVLGVDDGVGNLAAGSLALSVGPNRFVATGPATLKSGVCSSVYNLTSKDAAGNTAGVLTNTTLNLVDGSSTGTFFSDNACSTAITTLSIATGGSSASYYFKDTTAATRVLNADDAASILDSASITTIVTPDRLAITGLTASTAGTCEAYVISSRDTNGNAANVLTNTTINIGDGPGSGTIYGDSGCSTAVTSRTIPAGSGSVTVYYTNMISESVTLSATDAASYLASATLNVSTGPDRLEFTGPTTRKSGVCTAYTVTTTDTWGNAAATFANLTVNLSDTSAVGAFYSDAGCSSGITSKTILAGSSSAIVYFKDDKAESVTLTADDASAGLSSDSHTVSIGPDRMILSGTTTIKSGVCQPYAITFKDTQGTTAGVLASTQVNLADGSAAGSFYSDIGCSTVISNATVAANVSSTTVYYKNTTAEAVTITATDAAASLASSSMNLSIGPDRITITGATAFNSGTCQTYTIHTRDAANAIANALTNLTIQLTDGTAAGSYYSNAACTTSITQTSIANGSSTATVYYKDAIAETLTLSAADGASDLTTGTLNVSTGPDRLIITGSASPKSGVCSAYTVTTKDFSGNTANALTNLTVSLTDTSSTGSFYSDGTCATSTTSVSVTSGTSAGLFYYKNNVAEAVSLTANESTSALASHTFGVSFGPDRLLLTGAATFKSGTCQAYTATAKDAAGNTANVPVSTAVNLSQGSALGAFYSDASCSTSSVSSTMAAGSSAVTFYYRNTTAEGVTLAVADSSTTLASTTLNVVSGPDRLVLAGSAQIKAGVCVSYAVRTRDAAGNFANVLTNTTVNLTDGTAAGAYFSDNACASGITQTTVASGTSATTVYYKNDKAETVSLNAADNASYLASGSLGIAVAPDRIVISGNTAFKSGTCQAFTATTKDANGTTANVLTNTTMNLSDGSAQGSFFSDNSCTSGAATVAIGSGSSSVTFYYKDLKGENITLSAADAASNLSTGTLNVDAGPDRLTVTGALSFNSSTCQAYTLVTKDAAGNTYGVLASTTVDLSDGLSNGGFFSNSGCTTAITQSTFAAGGSSATVYYKNAVAQSTTLSFTDTPSNLTSASINVVSGPERLVVTGSTSFKAGSCQTYSVVSRDGAGNSANVLSSTTVNLDDGAANGTFYSDSSCATSVASRSIASGSNATTFYYKNSVAESITLTAVDAASSLTSGTLNLTAGPDRLALAANASFESGTCQAVTVTSKDPGGTTANVLSNTVVNLTDGLANGTFYSNATCATSVTQTSITAGSNTATVYYRNLTAEAITLSASDSASDLSTGMLNVTSGPDRLIVTGSSNFRSGLCQAITVTSRDAAGNAAGTLAAVTVNLADGSASGTYYSDAACSNTITQTTIALNSSSSTVYYKDLSAESVLLTATDNAAKLTSGSLSANVGPDHLILTGTSSFKSGTCQILTLTTKDASNATAGVLSNKTFNLTDDVASGVFYSENTCSTSMTTASMLAGANSTTFYYRNDIAESITFNVDDASSELSSASLTVSAGPSYMTLTGSATFRSGTCQPYTVTTKDAANNTKGVLANTVFDIDDGSGSGAFYSDNTCATTITQTSLTAGSSSRIVYYRNDIAESVVLTLADNPVNMTGASLSVTAGPDRLLVAGNSSFKSGTCQAFTVTTKDAGGNTKNVLATTTVNLTDGAASGVFYSDNACSTSMTQASISSGANTITVYYKNSVGESITLTASDQASNLSNGTLSVSSGPDRLTLAISSSFKSGTCQAVSITTKDAAGNATGVLTATTVNVSDGSASGVFYSDVACATSITQTSIASGVSSATVYYKNDVAETITITSSDNAANLSSGTATTTTGPDRIIVTGSASFKSGTCQSFTATTRDSVGNAKGVLVGTTFDLTDGTATGAYYSDSGCATGITQASLTSGSSSVTFYYKDNKAESVTLSVADAASNLTVGTLTVSSGPDHLLLTGNATFTAGSCQAYTITAKDANGTTASVLANTTIGLTDGTASGAYYSDNACATGITQTSIASGSNTTTVYYKNATAEAVTLTATDVPANLTSSSLSVTGGPDRLVIAGSTTFKSGVCQAYTVTSKDAANNAANVLTTTTANVSDGTSAGSYYSNATCTTGTTQTSIASGSNTVTIYYKTDVAETVVLTATDGASVLTQGTLTVHSGPDRIVLAGNAAFKSGSCQAFTLTTKDASNNTSGVLASTTIDLDDGTASGAFFSDNTCTTSDGQIVLASGASSATVYYKNATAQAVTLTATDSPANLTAASLSVSSGPDRLDITGATVFVSGTCTAYTIKTQDTNGTTANALSNLTLNLDDGAASGSFYSNNTCGTGITQTTIASGSNTTTVYYKSNVAESITLSVSDVAANLASASVNITQGPSHIVIVGASTFKSGVCTSYTLRTRDASNANASVLTDTTINLADGTASGSFYSNNTCTTSASSITVPNGSSSAIVYYKNDVAQAATLTADDAASILTSGALSVSSGPDRLIVTGSASFRSGTCQAVTITSKDTAGNTAAVISATTINVTDGTSPGSFFSDATCATGITQSSLSSGASSVIVYYKTSAAESIVLSAADNAASLATGTLSITSGPDRLSLAGNATFKSGTCQAVTVTTKDAGGTTASVLSNTSIDFTDGSALGDFFSDSGCSTSASNVSIASGSNSGTIYYKNAKAEAITIQSTDAASSLAAATLAMTSGPDRLIVTGASSFKSGTCQAFTVTSKDAAANTTGVLASTTVNLTDGAAAGAFYSDVGCSTSTTNISIASGSSAATFYYSNTVAEGATLSATDAAASLTTGTFSVTSGPDRLIVTGASSFKSGTCQALTVTAKDTAGNTKNVLANIAVTFTDAAASGSFYTDNACGTAGSQVTVNSGTSSAVLYYKNNVGENVTFTAADDASELASGSLNVVVGPDRIIVTGNATFRAGVCEPFTITTKDTAGNTKNVLGTTTIDLTDGSASGGYFSDSGCGTSITQTSIASGANNVVVYYKNDVAESGTLSAADNAGVLATGTRAITSGPDRLTIATTTPFKSAVCHPVSITSKDAAGNSKNPLITVTVNLDDGAAAGSYYSDNSCATGITQTSIANTGHTTTVYYKTNTAAAITLTASDDAGALSSGSANVTAGPDRLILSGSATPKSGVCVAYSITSQDAAGNTANVLTATTLNFTDGAASGSFFSDNTCATGATQGTIASGSSSTTVYYKTNVAENVTLSAADAAANLTTATLSVKSGPDRLIVAGNASFKAGTCQSFSITSKDASSTTSGVLANTTINVDDGVANGAFYSDDACGTSVSSVSLSTGSSSMTVYYKNDVAEAITVSASDAGGILTTGTFSTRSGPDRLTLAGPSNISSGSCSTAYTVTSKDPAGNASNVLTNTTVNLTDALAAGFFYSNATCTLPITSVSISSGASSASFYYKDTASESVVLTATDAASTLTSATFNVAVGPDHLVISGPTAVISGQCSTAYTVTTKDAGGSTASVLSSTTINLSGKGAGEFYSNATCTLANSTYVLAPGSSSATFYFKDASAESLTFSADDGAGGLTAGTLAVATGPDRLSLAANATFKSGTCQAVTVATKDSTGTAANALGALTINLDDGTASGAFFSNAACTTSITQTSISSGSGSSTVYYLNSNAEAITLRAVESGGNLTTATANVTSGPSKLILAGATTFSSGVCQAYSVTTKDDANATKNPLSNVTIDLTDGSAAGAFYSDAACSSGITQTNISTASSSAIVYYRDNVAEAITLSAADAAGSLTTGTLNVNAGPNHFTVSANPTFKSGTCQAVTVTTKDQAASPAAVLANTTINLSDGAASGTFFTTNTCATTTTSASIANGSNNVIVYYKNDVAESITLNADDAASSLASGSTTVTSGPDRLLLAGSASLKSGSCVSYSVTSKDTAGNIANVLVPTTINLTDGTANGAYYSDNTCATSTTTTSIPSGSSSSTFYYKNNVAEAITLSAADAASSLATSTLNVTSGPDHLIVTGSTAPKSGICVEYTVTTKDVTNVTANVLTNTTVTLSDGSADGSFFSENTCSTGASSVSIASGSSTATFYYKNSKAQTTTLTAADNAGVLTSGTIAIETGPDRIVVAGAASFKSGTCQAYSVTTKDAASNTANVLTNTTINIADGSASGTFYSENTCATSTTQVSVASGASTATVYYKNNVAESIVLTASDQASSLTSGTLNVASGPDRLNIAGASSFESGSCQAFTVTTRDTAGTAKNALAAVTVNLDDGAAIGTFYSDNACSSSITQTSISSGANTSTVYYKNNKAETATLSGSDNGSILNTGTTAITVGPSQLVIAGSTSFNSGACSSFTVSTRDAANSTANAISTVTVDLTDGTASGSFFSENTCATGATQATIASGSSTTTIYYKNNVAENAILSAADAASALATGTLTVATGPDRLVVTGSSNFKSGTCQAYSVTTKDTAGNTKNALANLTIGLDDGAASGAFFSDNTCATGITQTSIASGSSTTQVYYKDNIAEGIVLTASDTAASLASGTLSITAGPDHLDLTGPTNPLSGTCAAFTVTTRDANNNVSNVSGTLTVNVSDGAATGTIYSDNTCATVASSISVTNGTSTKTFYYKASTAQAVTLTTTDSGSSLASDTLSFDVEPNHLVLAGSTAFKAGTCQAYTITTKDASNATAPMAAALTVNLDDGTALGGFFSDNTCASTITSKIIAATTSAVTVYYKNDVAESTTLTASDNAGNLTSSTLAITSGPDRLVIGSATSMKSGTCQAYTVTSKDPAGNAANVGANLTIDLTDGSAAGSFYSDNACGTSITQKALTSGSNSVTIYYRNNTAESATLTASDNAGSLTAGTISVTTGPDRLMIAGTATFKSGTCQTYTITSKDAAGVTANVAGGNVTVNLNDGAASGTFHSNNTCSSAITSATILDGSSSVTVYYRNDVAEAGTMNADDAASNLASGALAITVGPDRLILTGNTTIKSGVCEPYTVSANDTSGNTKNVLSNTLINLEDGSAAGGFYSDNTCGTGITTKTMSSGTSSVIVYYKDNAAESISLSATDDAASLAATSLAIVTGPDRITVVASSPVLSGSCQALTVTTHDANSTAANVVTATTVNMTDGTAQGSFFSENTCTTSSSALSFTVGTGTGTIYYKNNKAESATITAADGSGNLTSGTVSIVTTPDRLTWTGSASPLADACVAYTIAAQDATGTNANVNANTSISLTGAGSGSFYSDNACAVPVTDTTIGSGTSSKTVYYKNTLGESLTFSADDGAGGMTTGTKAILVDCGATSFEVTLAGGGTSVTAGVGFDIQLTAKASGSTKTCYVGNHTISWTMTGNTAGTPQCGETSGAPIAPSQTTLNFTAGVATTTTTNAKFKAMQNNATITAGDGTISGTSANLAVGVGPVCRIQLRSAASNGGTTFTGANIDLNVSSVTTNSSAVAYAAGYDAYGQYNSDVSVTWSGTGVVHPWSRTTTNTDDTAHVYGVAVGSGMLQADYAGGGGDKTASASFTVSSTNSVGTLTSTTTDSATRTQLGSNTVYQSKDWNTSGDAMTAWKADATKGWYTESFNSSRGSRKGFPDRVFLVANANGLDIVDATNNHLYMRFAKGAGYAIDSTFGDVVSATGLNGKIYVSMRDSGATTGAFIVFDFVANSITRYGTGGRYTWNGGGIESRNTVSTWTNASATPALPSNVIYKSSARSISSIDYVLLGTQTGAVLYQNNSGTISIYKDPTASPVRGVALTSDGKLYYTENTVGILRYDATLPLSADWSPTRTYANSSTVNVALANFNGLTVAEGTSAASANANTILSATGHGVSVIQEHSSFGSESSKVYTTTGTGYTSFGQQLNFNGTSGSASMTNATSITRTATYEMLVRPTSTITSGSPTAYLFDRGSLGTDAYGLRFNGTDGRMHCYANKGSTTSFAASTTTSWSAGQWYHVACVFENFTNDMKVTIYVDGVAQGSVTIANMNTWGGSIGTIYFGSRGGAADFWKGSIDDFRLSNISRYTTNFTVPSTALSADGNSLILHNFDNNSGSTATAATGANATLNSGAWFSTPLLAGTSDVITGVDVNVQGATATAEVVSSGTAGAWSELTNAHTTNATLNTSATGLDAQSVDLYQVDSATDSDIAIGLTSGGLRLQRR